MLYTVKEKPIISAIKFDGELTPELEELGFNYVTRYGKDRCQFCGKPLTEHVLGYNNMVCPGHYIMYEGKNVVNIMSIENFEKIYEPLVKNGN